jgi:hypothetical protein
MGSSAHPAKVAVVGTRANAPNTFTTRWWYNDNPINFMKLELGEPLWPAAFGGTFSNKKLYLSYWIRSNLTISNSFSQGKFTRYNSAPHNIDNSDPGVFTFPLDGKQSAGQTQFDAVPVQSGGTWQRHEVYLESNASTPRFDSWFRYRCIVGSMSSLGGNFEFRTPSDALYTSNSSNPGWLTNWNAIIPGVIGFDGQDSTFTNQQLDIANVYVDTNFERFEISTAANLTAWTAGLAPFNSTDGTPREVQGRWRRDSSTQSTVYINQGQFTNLSGKYLWYVNGFKTAELVGQFL